MTMIRMSDLPLLQVERWHSQLFIEPQASSGPRATLFAISLPRATGSLAPPGQDTAALHPGPPPHLDLMFPVVRHHRGVPLCIFLESWDSAVHFGGTEDQRSERPWRFRIGTGRLKF